jgi:hypothetical protein
MLSGIRILILARTLRIGNDAFDEHFDEVHRLDHQETNRKAIRDRKELRCKKDPELFPFPAFYGVFSNTEFYDYW